jgi:hypothetical protein
MSTLPDQLKMIDYTEMLNIDPGAFPPVEQDTECVDPFDRSTRVTADMLRKRPDILNALLEPLKDMLLPWENEEEDEPDDWIINQIINALNLDPFIQTTVFECLNGMADIGDLEGEEMYFPSIFSMDTVTEIEQQQNRGGFREDHDGVPAKYTHLSSKHQDMIFSNPEARKFLAPLSNITDEFVEQLCQGVQPTD